MISSNLKIIDGKKLSQEFLIGLKKDIALLKSKHKLVPHLCIIQVGDNQSSNLYIQNKISRAKSLAIDTTHLRFNVDVLESELIDSIDKINKDNKVHGVIVQLPLPRHISVTNISESIDPRKDVDGFHPTNLGYLLRGENMGFIPCTPLGCLHLLKHYIKKLESKHVVVVGRSNIVGRPLALLLINNNATVTLCHSYTNNLQEITRSADVVITAIGSPKLFNKSYFREGSIVIDVGINTIEGSGFVGDVDFDDVIDKVSFITPVPGGVGPMTVAYLMSNLYKAAILNIFRK